MEQAQTSKKMVILRILSVVAILVWMFLISGFSSQNGEESSGLSMQVSFVVMEGYNNLSDIQMTDEQIYMEAQNIEIPVRKLAHMTEYGILAILFFLAFAAFGRKRFCYPFAVLCSFGYAMSDEYHQTFVEGRSGQFSDALIDTAGAAIAMLAVFGMRKLISARSFRKKE